LDDHPLRIWDEARIAANALEMYKNGNWLVTFYDGAPESWNTKPPFLIWLQVFLMHLIGPGELALRLPSAFAALFTCVLILGLSKNYLKSAFFGFTAALILITSLGYTQFHVTRSGDYDALLVFFMTAYAFSFFAFIETEKPFYLNLFFLFLGLGIMTKSVQAMMFLPALIVYSVYCRKMSLLFSRNFILGGAAVFIIVMSYYLLRESSDPGYLQNVWDNELGGRYLVTNEGHQEEFLFYFKTLYNHHFSHWFWLFPLGILLASFTGNSRLKKLIAFSTLTAISYWLVISFSQTKLEWYEAPLFPLISIISAAPIYLVYSFISKLTAEKGKALRLSIPVILILATFYDPYAMTLGRLYKPKPFSWEKGIYEVGFVLQETLRKENSTPDYDICFEGYHAHLRFYADIISDRGTPINSIKKEDLKQGDVVWVSQPEIKQFIESQYQFKHIDYFNGAVKYEIVQQL
jgi:4-amino-4-deoxy-L-arabinose transferase-like glycosyltransferase